MSRFGLGFNQKNNFNGTTPVSTSAIYMGAMRGKGSTTRKFNYCKTHSPAPSLCINQFINIQGGSSTPVPPPPPSSAWSPVPGQSFVDQGGDIPSSGVVDNKGNVYVFSNNQLSIYSKSKQSWQPSVSVSSGSAPTTLYLLSNNDVVYIGGNFTSLVADSVTLTTNYFASYNTTTSTWSNLNASNYITSPITAFTVKNNKIYIAVQGGTTLITYNINTASWGTLGFIASNFTLNGMFIDSKETIYIIANNTFVTNANVVVKIMNEQTSQVGTGYFNGNLNTITIDSNNNVYVGGNFTQYIDPTAGTTVNMNYVSTWNGITWLPIPSSNGNLNGGVNTITIDSKNNLYIGGAINTSTTTLNNISKWSPSNPAFTALTYGLNDVVTYLFTGNNNLYVLGVFSGYYNNVPPPNPPSVTQCKYMTTWTNIQN